MNAVLEAPPVKEIDLEEQIEVVIDHSLEFFKKDND